MKAIILAGGAGSRLYPLTEVTSTQLQAVFDKPMIYNPLTILIAAGIHDICLISTTADLTRLIKLLQAGSTWGISLTYSPPPRPAGIPEIGRASATQKKCRKTESSEHAVTT